MRPPAWPEWLRRWYWKAFPPKKKPAPALDQELLERAALAVWPMMLERAAKSNGGKLSSDGPVERQDWHHVLAIAAGSSWAAARAFVEGRPK